MLTHQSPVLKPPLLKTAGMRAQEPLSFPFYHHKEGCKIGSSLFPSCPPPFFFPTAPGTVSCPLHGTQHGGHDPSLGLAPRHLEEPVGTGGAAGARGSLWGCDELARQPAALQLKVL